MGDFNGDGRSDLAVTSSKFSILLGNGDGTFAAAADYGAAVPSRSVAVGDFNGDGRSDLAVLNADNVWILLNSSRHCARVVLPR